MYLSVCLSSLFFIKMLILSGCLGARRFRSLLYSLKPSLSFTYFGLVVFVMDLNVHLNAVSYLYP